MAASFGIGWRQVAICFLLLAAATMVAGTYSIVAIPLGREFQPSRMVLMLSMTVMSAVTAVISPLADSLMDRVSMRQLMLLGSALLVAAHLALSFVTSFTHVLVIYGLLMAPAGLLLGPMAISVLLSRWFVRHRGRALGIALAGISMGAVVFPPLIQTLLDGFHWREAFRLVALILLFCTVPAALLVVNRPADRGLQSDGDVAEAAAAGTRPAGSAAVPSVRSLLGDPTFWLVALMVAVVSAGMKGMVTNFAPIALDEGITADVAALLLSFYAACSFVAKLLFAGIADRINLRVLMFGMVVGFGVGMACLTQADGGFWPIAVGAALVGLFGGAMIPMQTFLVPKIYGQHVVGRVMGVLTTVLLIVSLAVPPLFGLIFDRTGSYAAIFVAFAALAAVTILGLPYIRLQQRGEEPRVAMAGG